jgi:16S rRNA processing protein RimM
MRGLEGYSVTVEGYGILGNIVEIMDYPGQLIARVIVDEKEVLFPLNEDFIMKLDVVAKSITLRLPEGLLDIYL